jgi:hypothetical protein
MHRLTKGAIFEYLQHQYVSRELQEWLKMLVTDKFIFLHLPRAGGTFVYDVVKKFFPSAREIGYHFPRELLPLEYSHLPILGIVRNPWEFYVSWYEHVRPRNSSSILFSWLSDHGKLGFIETIRNALNLGLNDKRLDVLIEMLPEHFDYSRRNIPNITKDSIRKVRGTGVGYYTFRFNQLFGKADDVFFCRLDSLREDLVTFFDGVGAATDELRDYVLSLDKKNTSEHTHESSYYTDELAKLVGIRDRQLVERFGFVFEGHALEKSAAQARDNADPARDSALALSISERWSCREP